MSAFKDLWKAMNNPGKRAEEIDLVIKQIDEEMQKRVDPTMWRHLLDKKQSLERERDGLNL